MPMNTSEPIPAAIRPGMRMRGNVAPPRPLASITSTAATMGEPKITEIAAKLPAAAKTSSSCGGASFFASFTANTARPPPIAMSGASGPSTSPSPRVAKAASATPGTMFGSVLPTCRPCAGTCPPPPGSRTIAERDRQAGQHDDGDRPPRGHRVEAEPFGEVAEGGELDLVDRLEETPRHQRDEQADRRGEDEQDDEVATAQHRLRIDRRRRRGSFSGHEAVPGALVRSRCRRP